MSALGPALRRTALQRDDAPALYYDDLSYSYRTLMERADAGAAALGQHGVRPGDRVAVGLTNSAELVTTILAVIHAGAVLVPLNPAYTPDELTYVVSDACACAAVVESGHAATLTGARVAGLSLIATTLSPAASARPQPIPNVDTDAAALIIYTSGTTGQPKGAVLSHRALYTNLMTVADAWRWTPADRLLLTLPCFHLHGLGLGILTSLLVGSSVVLRRRFVAEEVCADLERLQCTMFFGVPTMYNRLVTLPEDTHDLSRMRLWVSGSAPLSAATFERFQARFGYALMDRYGMTECGFTLATPYDEPRRPGVVGRPLPGVSVRLIDCDAAEAGRLVDVPDGTQGEIAIRGANLFDGYWQRPADTARALLDGYLRSGDLAIREPDGMFRIVGRSSVDIIKTRGFKVSAVEIEEVLQRHSDVQEVAVVGLPDADQGERVVAAVTRTPGATVSADALRAYAREHLAPHKTPAAVIFIDEIPRTGPGKFKKKELIRQLTSPPA